MRTEGEMFVALSGHRVQELLTVTVEFDVGSFLRNRKRTRVRRVHMFPKCTDGVGSQFYIVYQFHIIFQVRVHPSESDGLRNKRARLRNTNFKIRTPNALRRGQDNYI